MSLMLEPGRLKWKDYEFEVTLGYTARCCLRSFLFNLARVIDRKNKTQDCPKNVTGGHLCFLSTMYTLTDLPRVLCSGQCPFLPKCAKAALSILL